MKKAIFLVVILYASIFGDLKKIEHDYNTGKITFSQKCYYEILSLFESDSLPPEYKQDHKKVLCGFPIIANIKANRHRISEPYLSKISKYIDSRPGGVPNTYITPDSIFMIHYTLDESSNDRIPNTDLDGNSVPDYIDTLAMILSHVYKKEVDTMGYKKFKEDTTAGPYFDVYIKKLTGEYGYTSWDEDNCTKCTPYIVVSNDYNDGGYYTSGIDALKVTLAHEFFHALQINYRWDYNYIYWYEISSVWMEDIVYDSVNDYLSYVDDYYNNTNEPLNKNFGISMYGKAIWAMYFTENYKNIDIVKECWENYEIPGKDPIDVFDEVLDNGFGYNYLNFAIWNVFTGAFSDTVNYFSEGNLFPQLKAQPFSSKLDTILKVSNLGIKYFKYTPISNGGLKFDLDGNIDNLKVFCVKFYNNGEDSIKVFENKELNDEVKLYNICSDANAVFFGFVNNDKYNIFEGNLKIEFDPNLVTSNYVKGYIYDSKYVPIEQAIIISYDTAFNIIDRAVSDSKGAFTVKYADGQPYFYLDVLAFGYAPIKKEKIILNNLNNGVIELKLKNATEKLIGVFPNPAANYINFGYVVKYDYPEQTDFEIKIYSVGGKLLKSKIITNESSFEMMDVSDLSSGIYLYYLKVGDISKKGKLIIKR